MFHAVVDNHAVVNGKVGILQSFQHRLHLSLQPHIVLVGKEDDVALGMLQGIFEVVGRAVQGKRCGHTRRVMVQDADPRIAV